MFQLRSHFGTLLCNGINSAKIDILSILDQVLIISSQKLKPALLNPLDLKSLLTELETASLIPQVSPTPMEWLKHLVYVQVHETSIIHDVRHPVHCITHSPS